MNGEPGAAPWPTAVRIARTVELLVVLTLAAVLVTDLVSVARMQGGAGTRVGSATLNLVAMFVIVHRAMALLQRRMARPGARRAMGAVKWALAISVPLMAGGVIERAAHQANVARVARAVEEVKTRIDAALARGGPLKPADLDGLHAPFVRGLQVDATTGAFLLHATLPAVDIDGYTAAYSTADGRLRVWHNDLPADEPPPLAPAGEIVTCTGGEALRCR